MKKLIPIPRSGPSPVAARARRLLLAQLLVADHLQGQREGARVVAGVVLPAGGAAVRELLGAQQVAHPQLGRVEPEVEGEHVDQALHEVGRLGHPERARVGDAAGRLVRVHAGDPAVRGGHVVGAGERVEEPGGEPRRLRGGVERAVVGEHPHAQRGDPPVAGRRDLAVHVVVAGERRGHEVLRAVLHPLDRGAHHAATPPPRTRTPGRVPTLLPNPPPMSGATMRIRCSGIPVTRESSTRCACGACAVAYTVSLLGDRVVVGHDAAGLQRRRVHPRVDQVAGAHVLGGREHGVGGRGVARLPVEDVVVGLVAHARRVGVQRVAGVDDGGQRRVLDVDQRERVAGGVAGLGDDERDLLPLVAHLVGGEHRLHVVGERGHPGEAALGELLAGEHGAHERVRLGGQRVDGDDPGAGVRAAQHGGVQHAGQRDVVDEPAAAAHEPGVLFARHPTEAHSDSTHTGGLTHTAAVCVAQAVCVSGHGTAASDRPDDVRVAGAAAGDARDGRADLLARSGRACGRAATGP